MSPSQNNWVAKSLKLEQQILTSELQLAKESIGHAPTKGGVAENIWLGFFRRYLPDRYEVSSGFVVDSRGAISDQIDIIIFDRYFTPVLLAQETHRYIPAEAVYAVFEVKPNLTPEHLKYAENKAASVRNLKRTSRAMISGGEVTPARKQFDILAGILSVDGWVEGNFEKKTREHLSTNIKGLLNCGCCLTLGAFDTFGDGKEIKSSNEFMNPKNYKFFILSDMALPYIMIRLLGALQVLGSVPAIEWNKYAEHLIGAPKG